MSGTSSPSSRRTRGPMPSPSRSAKRSSISDAVRRIGPAGLLVAGAAVWATVGGIGLFIGSARLAAGALVAATAFAGAFAVFLIVSERRRHEDVEDELQSESRFLESLVGSITGLSEAREPAAILERTREEARRLFDARSADLVRPDDAEVRDAHVVEG